MSVASVADAGDIVSVRVGHENPFAHLWELGYRKLVPIIPPDAEISDRSVLHARVGTHQDGRGKTPGISKSDGTWVSFDWNSYDADEHDLQRWNGMGAGVGIRTGDLGDGTALVLIDADTMDPELAKRIMTAVGRLGVLPVRYGRRPKAGYLARVRTPFTYARIEFGQRNEKGNLTERVEILSDGRQFVAHGIHPKTGQPYEWPDGIPPIDELPILEPDQLLGLLDELRPLLPSASETMREGAAKDVEQATLRGDPALIRRAVENTPNTSDAFPSRESYLALGYAIKAAIPDDEPTAFAIFADWCERWQDPPPGLLNEPAIIEADWRRMKPPYKRGASYVYELAERHSKGAFSRAEQWFEPIVEKAPLFPEILDDAFAPPKRFQFTPFLEASRSALTSSTRPLVKGLLDQGAMTVLYGESNTGKTFVAMDLAFHIAAGMAWGGRRVAKMAVVYVAAEGGAGARKRAAALHARFGTKAEDVPFFFLLAPVNLLRADADLAPLIESIQAIGLVVGLVVIDTLSRAMAGGDENTSTDMGAMVKHLDAVRSATGAHLLVVHHTGKDRARGARGHSLLRAATDTEIEIADGQIEVTKQRDIDKGFGSAFRLDVVQLGIDADGDPITSCTVRLVADGDAVEDAPSAPLTGKEKEVAEAVAALEDACDGAWAGASAAEVVVALFARNVMMDTNTVRFHLRNLVVKRALAKADRGRFTREKGPEFRRKSVPTIGDGGQSVFD